MILKKSVLITLVFLVGINGLSNISYGQEELPSYLKDRGRGIPTSMFGTYVEKGQILLYPFYEFYYDNDLEYEAAEFGYGSTLELRGKYRAHEGLIFIGYGISDHLAVEFEAGVITAELNKSKDDNSAMPAEIEESGLSDVEGQIRWRWNRENAKTPEIFNYFETVFPTGEKNSLIGTSVWEFKLGAGLVKGFSWGTVTFRIAGEYSEEEKKTELGEYAVEYLNRLSPKFRIYTGIEGSQDEVELITELQWHLSSRAFVKLNNAFGVTSKATDWAPELGVLFVF